MGDLVRRNQPQGLVQLCREHPLAQGLAFAWVAGNGDIDVYTGKVGATEGTRMANGGFNGRLSRVGAGNGDIGFGTRPDLSFSGLTHQTVFSEIYVPNTGSVSGYFCGRVESNWDYSLSIDSGAQQIAFGTGGHSGGQSVLYPASSVFQGLLPLQGRPVSVAGTYDGALAKLYVDGLLGSSATETGSFPNDTDRLAIGSRGGGNQGASQLSGASLSVLLIYKRTLSAAEIATLSANPWQIFQPIDDTIFSVGAPTPTPTPTPTPAASFAATPVASAALTSALTTAIPFAATPIAQAILSPSLTTAIPLAASVTASASTTSALTTAIPLATAPAASASLAPALSTAIQFGASTVASARTLADLTTVISLSVAPVVSARMLADLTTAISLAAAPVASARITGDLLTSLPLAASMGASASLVASLTTHETLAAALSASAGFVSELSTSINFAFGGVARATLTASLLVGSQVGPTPGNTIEGFSRVREITGNRVRVLLGSSRIRRI